MAEVLGVAASGVGIVSLAIQLADSIKKLKDFCEDVKNVPDDIKYITHQLDILTLQLGDVAKEQQTNPVDFNSDEGLKQCLAACQQGTAQLVTIVKELEDKIAKKGRMGAIRAVLRREKIAILGRRLDSAKTSLMFSYMMYSKALQSRTFTLEMQRLRDEVVHSISTMAENINSNTVAPTTTRSRLAHTNIVAQSSVRSNSSNNEEVNETIRPKLDRRAGRRKRHTKRVSKYGFKITPWFTSQVWELNVARSSYGWDACLRIYNTVPDDSPLLACCFNGNLVGLMQLLDSGRASIHDRDKYGQSVLHLVALGASILPDTRQSFFIETTRYLIDKGADGSVVDTRGQLPIQMLACNPSNSIGLGTVAELTKLYRMLIFEGLDDVIDWSDPYSLSSTISVSATYVPLNIFSEALEQLWPPYSNRPVQERLTYTLDRSVIFGHGDTDFGLLDVWLGPTDFIDDVQHVSLGRCASVLAQALFLDDSKSVSLWRRIFKTGLRQGNSLYCMEHDEYRQHYVTPMAAFISAWCSLGKDYSRSFEEEAEEAISKWLTELIVAGIDLNWFGAHESQAWRLRSGFQKSCEVQGHIFKIRSSPFTRIVGFDYGPIPDDWRLHFKENLYSPQRIRSEWEFEKHLEEVYHDFGEFWRMIEQPESFMPGAWVD